MSECASETSDGTAISAAGSQATSRKRVHREWDTISLIGSGTDEKHPATRASQICYDKQSALGQIFTPEVMVLASLARDSLKLADIVYNAYSRTRKHRSADWTTTPEGRERLNEYQRSVQELSTSIRGAISAALEHDPPSLLTPPSCSLPFPSMLYVLSIVTRTILHS